VNGFTPGDVVWEDSFDGDELNELVWEYDLGNGVDGWGNNELQTYETGAVSVGGGVLRITASGDAVNGFKSGRIKSKSGFQYKYGTLEASIKIPEVTAGLWPSLWTLGGNFDEVGWPKAGEIDVMEMGQGLAISQGVAERRVVCAAHWDLDGVYGFDAGSYDVPEPSTLTDGTFHIFKLDWTPTSLRTSVDDVTIWQFNIGEGSACLDCAEFHQFHFLLLNLAVGGRFTYAGQDASSSAAESSSAAYSCTDSTGGGCALRAPTDITADLPAVMEVDYIKLIANADTQIKPDEATPVDSDVTLQPSQRPSILSSSPPSISIVGKIDSPPPTVKTASPTDAALGGIDPAPPLIPTIAPSYGKAGKAGTAGPTEVGLGRIDQAAPDGKAGTGKAGTGKAGTGKAGTGKAGTGKAGLDSRVEGDNLNLVASNSQLQNAPSAAYRFSPSMVEFIAGLVTLICCSALFF
jgi:beta-glucanase (GH16 family)